MSIVHIRSEAPYELEPSLFIQKLNEHIINPFRETKDSKIIYFFNTPTNMTECFINIVDEHLKKEKGDLDVAFEDFLIFYKKQVEGISKEMEVLDQLTFTMSSFSSVLSLFERELRERLLLIKNKDSRMYFKYIGFGGTFTQSLMVQSIKCLLKEAKVSINNSVHVDRNLMVDKDKTMISLEKEERNLSRSDIILVPSSLAFVGSNKRRSFVENIQPQLEEVYSEFFQVEKKIALA
jgi:hypothetical protein